MTKLYLVTGFLGAGKSTFLQAFTRAFPEKRIALIINEFGKNGVDGALLRESALEMTEIDNGSIFCSCRAEQFQEAVLDILKRHQAELIFVEASGLADPTAVRGIFSQDIYGDLEYAGAICIVDAVRFHKVYQTAKVSRMQLAISDLVLINKTDLATRQQIDEITTIVKAQKPGRPVHETVYGAFQRQWLQEMENPEPEDGPAEPHTKDLTLRKLTLTVSGFDLAALTSFLKMFADDTYRIKGFVQLPEGCYLVDCVGPIVEVKPYTGETNALNHLTVLFGNGLPAKRSIREAVSWFEQANVELEG